MGGRGSAGGKGASSVMNKGAGGSGSSANSAAAKIKATNTKFSTTQINSMSRRQLENVATAVFAKQNMARGLSAEEAVYRARSLMSGNTTAQLRKYIKRNG